MECTFRFAQKSDAELLMKFIREFASFQRAGDPVRASEERLERWMFDEGMAEAVFVMLEGKEVGFALFNHGFSALQGKPSIYVECIYLLEEYRRLGLGQALFCYLGHIAQERDWVRVECCAPDWNEGSGVFYNALGAEEMNGWTMYRFAGEALEHLAERSDGIDK